MAKLVAQGELNGLISYKDEPHTVCATSDPEEIAVIQKVLFGADQADADGGAQDGDLDIKVSKNFLFFRQQLKLELRLELEEGDPGYIAPEG